MKVYFDSSSFAKKFIDEEGSDEVEDAVAEATGVGLSVICVPEVVSALRRRRLDRQLAPDQYEIAKASLFDHVRDADIVELNPSVIRAVIDVLESNRIRTLDALHVACALEWEAELFVSSDRRQCVAAKKAGLATRQV